MKLLITAITLLFTINTSAQIERDKLLHFSAGVVGSTLTGALTYSVTQDANKAFWGAIISGSALGLGKELYDTRSGGSGFDTRDLGFTLVGTVLGTYLTKLLTRTKRQHDKRRIKRKD